MPKQKTTKRMLLSSVLSLVLCITMLIGTTFAWFTDTATSKNNKIVAGNLDVQLLMKDSTGNYVDIGKDSASIFGANSLVAQNDNSDTIWEPGKTQIAYLAIRNNGNLDLKYQVALEVRNPEGGKDLYKAMQYAIQPDKQENADAWTTGYDVVLGNQTVSAPDVPLTKGATHYFALAIHMKEEAGNEYQGGQIDFDITVLATQLASEYDSFNNQYDEMAEFLSKDANGNYVVSTAAELTYLAYSVNTGIDTYENETIVLTKNIDLGGRNWTSIGNSSNGFNGTFDGNNNTISNFKVKANTNAGLFGYALNGGNIKNLKVENAEIRANDYAGAILGRGYTDIDNCHVKNVTVITTPYVTSDGTYDGGAKAGGVVGQLLEGAGNTVTNCSATDVKIYAFRDLGGVVGMVHNNNSASGNTASNVTLGYLLCDKITEDENENAGAIYGRVQSSASVSPAKDSAENTNYTLVYAVYDAMSLTSLANIVNNGDASKKDAFIEKTVVMLNDIDLGGANWTPIGNIFNKNEFAGTFDGQNYTVSNFKVDNKSGAALFGFVRHSGHYDARVMNVTVKNVVATGGDYVGGVVGQLYGTIENCHAYNVKATATPFELSNGSYDGGAKAGGVVGWMESGSSYTATNCTAHNVQIKAYRDLGAVIGMAHNNNTVTDCKAYDSTLEYVFLEDGCSYDGNKVNENMGEVIGRRGANVNESGTHFENVTCLRLTKISDGFAKDEQGKYYVSNANGMTYFANTVKNGNKYAGETVVMQNDIDLGEKNWTPIGQTGATQFEGVFDGVNHTISNLKVDSTNQTGANYSSGLFGWTHGEIKNVIVKGAKITGHHNVGVIAGALEEGQIINCHVSNATISCTMANSEANGDKAGGICGILTNTADKVIDCSVSNSTISAGRDAGQVVGAATAGKDANVTGCSATNVTVTANGTSTGANIKNEIIGRK